jgi:hypothetical protein
MANCRGNILYMDVSPEIRSSFQNIPMEYGELMQEVLGFFKKKHRLGGLCFFVFLGKINLPVF